jgi:hypothetical protein
LVNGLSKFFGEEEVEHAGAEEIKFDDKVASIKCLVNIEDENHKSLKKSITLKSRSATSSTSTSTSTSTSISTMTEAEFLGLLRSSEFTQIEDWYQAEKHGTNFNITNKQLDGFSSYSKYPQYIRN